jgi:ubiquinone/menaquinone biosynthesis C-methylase UbiE
MSEIREAYDTWSSQYDSDLNKTRDLEAIALQKVLAGRFFANVLEAGCGTGKNTIWLAQNSKTLLSVDLSPNMLQKAKQKVRDDHVRFQEVDITHKWEFTDDRFDLITFSLVLEHIQDLGHVFQQASEKLLAGGLVYMGELHPFKQYTGSKARFENKDGIHVVNCFTHHISDFVSAAKINNLSLIDIQEFFDSGSDPLPRILTLLFRKE